MKKVLGLDIGTNSIGAALINLPDKFEDYGKEGNIEWMGSRIIPESNYSKAFELGQKSSPKNMTPAGTRRQARGSRRLKHRYKLRRTRLIKVFKALGWLDESFPLDDPRKFKYDVREKGYSFKISDYLPFSKETIEELEREFGIDGKKSKKGKSIVPEDWIVYYLRKKALDRPVTFQELARIIYVLNQRRGFKSSRKDLKNADVLPYEEFKKIKDDKDNPEYQDKEYSTKFVSITKVISIEKKSEEPDKNKNFKYVIQVSDERIHPFEILRKKEPEWKDKELTFLIEQKVKKGKFEQLQPKTPSENDWGLCTTALDEKINSYRTPGEYFYEQIKEVYKNNKNFKARQYPVYRHRYQYELTQIWNKQCELNPELKKLNSDPVILIKLAEILYPTQAKNNLSKLAEFKSHDLLHIISNDIIYYQRELKSQKNSISECRYEKRKGIDGEYYGLKCIPRSSPLFQEFRIWQDIHNLRILEREVKEDNQTRLDVDVTSRFINDDNNTKEKLFELFNSKASINERDILLLLKEMYPESNIKLDIDKKEKIHSHRINLFAIREELKGNETLSRYRLLFKKANFDGENILSDREKLMKLWHIDYSITSSDEEKSKKGITKALTALLPDNPNKNHFIELFAKLAELKKEYGSYSACAIKKLLPLMRCGKFWNEAEIGQEIRERIEKIISAEFDESIDSETRKKIQKWEHEHGELNNIKDFSGLPAWLACYVVYGVHSEKNKAQIDSVEEFEKYIQKAIPNNSLRNPVVEQVVRETMFLVRDVWKKYGDIQEIHIELGRNLKNNSEERKKIAETQEENRKEKQRIKLLLYELMNDGFEQYVDIDEPKPFEFKERNFSWETKIEHVNFDVKPNPDSPADIEKFRVWRSLSRQSESEWAKKVKEEKIPAEQEIKKYVLWLSQNCRSPYTGKIIPLSKLFDTNQYEIEHIIPRSKMKNDSFDNIVIAEWGVNKAKGNQLAANFIKSSNGKCKYGDAEYKLFTYEEYEQYCDETFKLRRKKRKNLLAAEVPEGFIERQLNDTRYIGRKIADLLGLIAKNENGVIFTTGSITSELKNNWGLNKVWKELMKPRFERLEKITGKQYIINDKDEYGNPVIHFNVKENEGLDLKRIDHRHHTLDALIIALTTREHIRYLNTLNAADSDEEIKKIKQTLVKGKIREFREPWKNFVKDVKNKLEEVIVTYKANNKIISKPSNRIFKWIQKENKLIKTNKDEKCIQKSNKKWMSVRRSMFKEPLGVIWLKEVKEVSVWEAFKVHIERKLAERDLEKRKTAAYVYDKYARQVIDDIISRATFSIDEKDELLKEINTFLEKNSQKVATDKVDKKGKIRNKTIYKLNGVEYETIKIAHFVSYKTKRMSLAKKEYVEKLTVEKMKNDFPYFSFVNKTFYDSLPDKSKAIIINSGLEISADKRNSAFNQLFLEHILEYNNNAKEAFSPEGIEKLNQKAIENPAIGREIKSVTRLDGTVDIEDMFNGGFYETDKGAMAYFVMYENQQTKERKYPDPYPSIATHKAIEKIVKGEPIAEDREGFDKIILSPGDLVYVPTIEEIEKVKEGGDIKEIISWYDKRYISQRVYRVVSFSKQDLFCIKANISAPIIPYDRKAKLKGEIGWDNKSNTTMDGDVIIKDVCLKLKLNRLGDILIK